jgi:hypothetical protein
VAFIIFGLGYLDDQFDFFGNVHVKSIDEYREDHLVVNDNEENNIDLHSTN